MLNNNDMNVSSFPLETTPLFGAMNPSQVDLLWTMLRARQFESEEIIFRQGQLPTNIYIVMSGEIEFRVTRADGSECVVDTFSSGDAFGVGSIIGIQAQAGTAKVVSKVGASVLVLDRDALMQLQNDHLDLFSLLIMNAARHVSRRLYKEFAAPHK
jgi:CRP-like cAMP-binding protein